MTVLRVDASIQGERSASSALADLVTAEVTAAHGDVVRTRHLGADPLPSHAWGVATTAGFVPEEHRTPEQVEALGLAASLVAELREADAVVLAFPLYNWGVSQHVKTWIDLVITGAGPGVPVLDGTPVVLVTTRGGGYGPGAPKEEWEHSIGYLRRILVDVWGADLTVVERDLTLVGVNPAMDGLQEEAALQRKQAETAAVDAGRVLATR
jgi:FMN-dependent NADH-azoreductase